MTTSVKNVKEENLNLLRRVRAGEPDAEQQLISQNLGLVKNAARHFLNSGFEFDDLYQCGCIGLLKAVRNFDFEKGTALSTYAVPIILGEIKRHIRDNGTVKVSRHLKEISLRIYRAKDRLSTKLMRDPTLTELSEETGDSAEDIIQALDACAPVMSFDEPVGDDSTLGDFLGKDESEKIHEILALKQGLETLENIDKQIISLRYIKCKTQTETAKILNITQVQVSRKEKKLIELLKNKII